MISGSSLCSSFKKQLLLGGHNFQADTFKVALYGDQAPLSPDTTVYATDGEISGPGVEMRERYPTCERLAGGPQSVAHIAQN